MVVPPLIPMEVALFSRLWTKSPFALTMRGSIPGCSAHVGGKRRYELVQYSDTPNLPSLPLKFNAMAPDHEHGAIWKSKF